MFKNFFVCPENELNNLIKRENKNHSSTPKIYYAGFLRCTASLYEDSDDNCSAVNLNCYCVDYSDGTEDEVYDKFFNYIAMEAMEIQPCEEININKEMYNINIYFNDVDYCCLDGFWHTAELSEEEIECLKDLAG